ncbi:MAG: hypothetical protein QOH79_2028 [Acidimicrobiaceae bacterium]
MTKPVVAVVATFEESHFARVRPVVAALAAAGADTYVFTHRRFEAEVADDGGRFVDLYAGRPLEVLGDDSSPTAVREVTYAAHYADSVIEEMGSLNAQVIAYDTFAVVGRVAGHVLGIPYVNLCSGHNIDPERHLPQLYANPRFHIADVCHRAVERLREDYGMKEASPFFAMAALSPHLNVYGEPPQFLTPAEREVFEPVAFFGSLPRAELVPTKNGVRTNTDEVKVYVSFGTVIWRHFVPVAMAALGAIARAVAQRPGTEALITLGGAALAADAIRGLEQPGVRIEPYVDQWEALRTASMFVTHHGMKSTHEALVNEVPMLSYPFFWDQPSMATRCQELGLAVAMSETPSPQCTLSEADVHRAIDHVLSNRDTLHDRLAEARQWELDVIGNRPVVARQIIDLA